MKFVLTAIAALCLASVARAQAPATTPAASEASPTRGEGVGVIRRLDVKSGAITLQHGPIAALSWPAMTMTFKADPALLKSVSVGEKVDFTAKIDGPAPEIVAIQASK